MGFYLTPEHRLMTVFLLLKKPRNKNDFEVCNYYNYLVISLDNFCQDEL
jgi:hypothetical protein